MKGIIDDIKLKVFLWLGVEFFDEVCFYRQDDMIECIAFYNSNRVKDVKVIMIKK